MKDLYLFSLLVVMLLHIQGSESRKKKGGWFYTDREACQVERCDPKYGHFRQRGTENALKRVTEGYIRHGSICKCKLSKDFISMVKSLYSRPKSWLYRAMYFVGFGRKIRKYYKKIEFNGGLSS